MVAARRSASASTRRSRRTRPGTMVMLELEAMGLDRVRTELSAQYVDHNLLQADFRNADDHLFLRSACQRFGLWYSKPGNGVSHPVHMQRFGIPGKTLLGSDSHTVRGRLARDARDRRRRPRGRDGDGGRAVPPRDAADLGRPAGRGAAGLGERQGRDPRDAAAPRRDRRARAHHRVLGSRPRASVGDGPSRHRQHGRRARRDRDRVPVRRRGAAVPQLRGPRATTGSRCAPIRTRPTTSRKRSTSRRSSRSSRCRRVPATSSRCARSPAPRSRSASSGRPRTPG